MHPAVTYLGKEIHYRDTLLRMCSYTRRQSSYSSHLYDIHSEYHLNIRQYL